MGGRLSDRFGRGLPVISGIALLSLGVLPLAVWRGSTEVLLLVFSLSFAGTGLGLSSVGLQTAVLGSVKSHQTGFATGIYSTSRYLGSIAASSLLMLLLGSTTIEEAEVYIVYLVINLAAGISLMLSLGLNEKPDPA